MIIRTVLLTAISVQTASWLVLPPQKSPK